MNETGKQEVLKFANELDEVARILRASTTGARGHKTLKKTARLRLTEIKKNITPIKKITMENE